MATSNLEQLETGKRPKKLKIYVETCIEIPEFTDFSLKSFMTASVSGFVY